MFERDNAALVGMILNVSGLSVFCAPVCESPDGSDGRYFALGRREQWEWLEVSPRNFEYVCGEIWETPEWDAAAKKRLGCRRNCK